MLCSLQLELQHDKATPSGYEIPDVIDKVQSLRKLLSGNCNLTLISGLFTAIFNLVNFEKGN